MVIDTLAQLESYVALDARFGETAKFIENAAPKIFPPGDTNWMETGFMQWSWTMFQKKRPNRSTKRTISTWTFSACLRAANTSGMLRAESLKRKSPTIPEKDISFYEFSGSGSRLHLTEGSFAVYFLQDGHLPGMADGSCGNAEESW